MIRIPRQEVCIRLCSLLLVLALGACLPGRADGPDERILEPNWIALPMVPSMPDAVELNVHPIRARSNIGKGVYYRKETGEIQTDPVWSWTVSPAQYLSEVLDLVAAADPSIRLTDNSRNLSLQVELLSFGIEESEGGPWAHIIILARLRGADRQIQVFELKERSLIQGDMPRSLSKAMGKCLVAISRAALAECKKHAQ